MFLHGDFISNSLTLKNHCMYNFSGKAWTEEEEKLFENSTDEEVAALTQRTVKAVAQRRLRLKKEYKKQIKYKPWTEREMEVLVSTPSNAKVAKITGRTVAAVSYKRLTVTKTLTKSVSVTTTTPIEPRPILVGQKVTIVCPLGTFELDPTIHSGVIISECGVTFKKR